MIVTGIKDDDLRGFKYIDNIENNKQVVGTFVKNSAELKILNLNHTYDNLYHTYVDIKGFGSWYVDDLKTDEEFIESTLSLFDNTQKFDEPYQDTFKFPSTMGAWAKWIGEQVGIPLKGDFLNSEIELSDRPYIGSNPTWRSAVQVIAKYASSYAQTNYDNTYSIKWFDETLYEIEDWENFVHGNQKPPINVIILSSGDTNDNVKYPEETPEEPHELRIEDDWNYIDRYSINQAIYNQVNGFFYTPISKLNVPYGLLDLRAGQKIKSQDIEHIDVVTNITKHTLEWVGGEFDNPKAWTSSIEMAELSETTTNYNQANSALNRLLQVERSANKNTGEIQDLIKKTSDTTEKLTKFEMDLDSIKQQVSEIDDFTKDGETIDGNLNLNDVGNGYLLNLKIRPKDEHVAPTFPNFTIYPSDSTFTRDGLSIVRIKNLTTGSFTDYEIPVDLYYKDENTFDVLEYQYGSDKCTVTKKLKMVDGVLTEMESPVSTEYDFPVIDTTDGTYSITLLNYDQAYIYAKMIGKNDFSDNFALKRELSSAITQTKEYIQTEVKNLSTQVNGDIENLSSSITQTAEEIESDVSSYKETTDGAIESLSSSLTQTASSLSSEVKSYKETVDGQIEEVNGKFELYIEKDVEKLMSVFNLAVNQVVIESDNFKLDAKGNVIANSLTANKANIVDSVANNLTVNGGNIKIKDDGETGGYSNLKIESNSGTSTFYSSGFNIVSGQNNLSMNTSRINLTGLNALYPNKSNLRFYAEPGNMIVSDGPVSNIDNVIFSCNPDQINSRNIIIRQTPTLPQHAVRLQELNNRIDTSINKLSFVRGTTNYLEIKTPNGAFGVNTWSSDKRLKENIVESQYDALEKILKIHHKEFDYKDGVHVKIGYIADELEVVDPDFIFEVGEEKMKQPQISTIIPVITKAIQEQEQEILKLREELLILKKDV